MVTTRRQRSLLLALVALLVVAGAWMAFGSPAVAAGTATAPSGQADHGRQGVVSPGEVTDAVVAPAIGTARTADLRLLSLWILPGIAAALAARCLLRRQHLRPILLPRWSLTGSVANRAPPTAPLA